MEAYSKPTYSELCEFLDLLGEEYIRKIPKKLLAIFQSNIDEDYVPHINPNIPITEKSLHQDTLTLIAILYLKYWCNDENEIKRLKSIYTNNEYLYQKNH